MTHTLAVLLVVAAVLLHVVSDWLYLAARRRLMERESRTIQRFQAALEEHAKTLREVADEMADETYGPTPSSKVEAPRPSTYVTRGGKA